MGANSPPGVPAAYETGPRPNRIRKTRTYDQHAVGSGERTLRDGVTSAHQSGPKPGNQANQGAHQPSADFAGPSTPDSLKGHQRAEQRVIVGDAQTSGDDADEPGRLEAHRTLDRSVLAAGNPAHCQETAAPPQWHCPKRKAS